jgi:hypothetical protein
MSMKMSVFWDIALCSLVDTDQLASYTEGRGSILHNIYFIYN